jgi:hypothetical protein
MRLAADVGGVTSQYVALLRGDDVTLTREHVAGVRVSEQAARQP